MHSQSQDSLLAPGAKVSHLLDDVSGKPLLASALLGNRADALALYHRLHVSRATGNERILCELCSVPVYLVANADKRTFFFRHFVEDGSCPAVTRGLMSEEQINALRYHGQRESRRHFELKNLLASSLRADLAFSDPKIEGTWKGKDGKHLRRPDVHSRFRDEVDLALEVQLSTTFGRVMAEREVFYKNQGALLFWVFGEFSVDHARLMMEVIFAHNNRNAFIVSEASHDASQRERAFMLECCWVEPTWENGSIAWNERRQLVRFDELTQDIPNQRAYFVDTESLERALIEKHRERTLDERFIEAWLAKEAFDGRKRTPVPVQRELWDYFNYEFAERGAELPGLDDFCFRDLMRTLLLAKLGRSVGWGYTDFPSAAHFIPTGHKGFLWIFLAALHHHARLAGIEASDRSGNWAKKMDDYRRGQRDLDPAYAEDHRYDDAIRVAFPELSPFLPLPEIPF